MFLVSHCLTGQLQVIKNTANDSILSFRAIKQLTI